MAEFTVRPMPGQGEATVIRHHWSDEKRCRSLSLTQDSWKILGALANDCGNRSEVVEIITRYAYNANLDLASIRLELLRKTNNESGFPGEEKYQVEKAKLNGQAACEFTPPLTAEQPDTFGVDACGLKPVVEIDFDAPVQCSI